MGTYILQTIRYGWVPYLEPHCRMQSSNICVELQNMGPFSSLAEIFKHVQKSALEKILFYEELYYR
jgi:hypothetical protein